MKSPWAGFFDFSRREQLGLIFLVGVITSCLLVLNYGEVIFPKEVVDMTEKEAVLMAQINMKREVDKKARSSKYPSISKKKKNPLPSPFEFDPNNLSQRGYVELGFTEKQAKSIHNYLSKGGEIREKNDFKKLYVVSDYMYDRLQSYIRIEENSLSNSTKKPKTVFNKENSNLSIIKSIEVASQPLDLNTASAEELIDLRGVGPVYAKRIIGYRELLGGYSSTEQLSEVYGLKDDPELVRLIKPQVKVIGSDLKQVDVNTAEWKELVRHPYIDKKVANSIIAIRKTHGPYSSIEDLKQSHLIDEELYFRISPYLTVGTEIELVEPSE